MPSQAINLLDAVASLGDVDTVEELTKILVLNAGVLMDLAADEGDVLEVVALDDDLFLLGSRIADGNANWAHDNLALALTHEVGEGKALAALFNNVLDWEVGIDKAHLVTPAKGDTDDHVLDKAKEGADSGKELAVAEPAASNDLMVLSIILEIELEVAEVLSELTTWARNGNNARFD